MDGSKIDYRAIPRKQWSYAGHPYLSGEIVSSRLDVASLKLVPLRLAQQGTWNPDEHYWGEADDPIEAWAQSMIARGPRPEFVMEQILPGTNLDLDSGPIIDSNELQDAGDQEDANRVVMKLGQADLRCLDAHAHLGNRAFDDSSTKYGQKNLGARATGGNDQSGRLGGRTKASLTSWSVSAKR